MVKEAGSAAVLGLVEADWAVVAMAGLVAMAVVAMEGHSVEVETVGEAAVAQAAGRLAGAAAFSGIVRRCRT